MSLVALVSDVARSVIMPRYMSAVREQKADGSLFTQVDLAAQESLASALPRLIDCPVLGEEMSAEDQRRIWRQEQETGRGLWCIDPIDGTTNYVNCIPFFGVAVAHMVRGLPRLAVVCHPADDAIFYAERGHGAWLNEGIRLPTREAPSRLEDSVAGVDFKRIPKRLAQSLASSPPYYSQRSFGSSALEWCFVAAGRLDVYLHGGQMLWDYAAGSLILEEAGGAMCTLSHDDFAADDIWRRSVIVARSPPLLAAWRDWLRAHC
jgi:fructose-1,6-bisphosphatase/inositol monophosphatase family enzyme